MFNIRFGPAPRPTPPTELYERLGVSTDASVDSIKKAYRRLALQLHPDRRQNNDPDSDEQFKQVVEAYDILKDDRLRAVYDRHGLQHAKRAQQQASNGRDAANDADDLFATMFGHGGGPRNGTPFVDLFDLLRRQNAQWQQARQPTMQCSVTIEQIYQNEMITLDLPSRDADKSDAANDTQTRPEQRQQICVDSFAVFRDRLGRCTNRCLLQVPPDNTLVELLLQKHDTFEPLNERDLLLRRTVSVYEALGGYETTVCLPDKQKTVVQLSFANVVIKPHSQFLVEGLGLPPSGDLVVRFEVKFPDSVQQIDVALRQTLRWQHRNSTVGAPNSTNEAQPEPQKTIVITDNDRMT